MSSGGWGLGEVFSVLPGGGFGVGGAGFEASVEDGDEAAGEAAEGVVVVAAFGALLVVVGAGAGRGREGAEGLGHEGVGEPVVADPAGGDGFLLAGGAGQGAGAGVVAAGLAVGVAVRVVAEFCEHPGGEDWSQAGLGPVDLSVRVPAK